MKYRLIREYPDSPELGIEIIKSHISNSSLGSYDTYMIKGEEWFKLPNPENYPEFWREVVEKDYEILSLIEGKFIYPCDKYSKDYINQLFNTLGVSIHSVKRLSDGEVFTIGDKINNGIIKSIFIPFEFGTTTVCIQCDNKKGIYLKDIIKAKQPLFTTEDGVDIFEGDKLYSICNMLNIKKHRLFNARYDDNTLLNNRIFFNSDYKHFSTKEKAEEYIIMNKPILSLNDIFKNVEEMRKGLKTFENSQLAKRFKKLVQQKLNNKN